MPPAELPLPVASDLVLLALYLGAALAVSLYVWLTFVGPWLRHRSALDLDAKTRDLVKRHRAQDLIEEPGYLPPGDSLGVRP